VNEERSSSNHKKHGASYQAISMILWLRLITDKDTDETTYADLERIFGPKHDGIVALGSNALGCFLRESVHSLGCHRNILLHPAVTD
jgi:hypothetical protein